MFTMMKEFNSLVKLINFVRNFGNNMSFEYGSMLIASDTETDIEIIKTWSKTIKKLHGCFPLNIYYRKHGTFTDWNRLEQIRNDISYWNYQRVGQMTITYNLSTKIYNVSFNKNWK